MQDAVLPSYLCDFKFFIFGRENFLIGLSGKSKFIYDLILLSKKGKAIKAGVLSLLSQLLRCGSLDLELEMNIG